MASGIYNNNNKLYVNRISVLICKENYGKMTVKIADVETQKV